MFTLIVVLFGFIDFIDFVWFYFLFLPYSIYYLLLPEIVYEVYHDCHSAMVYIKE